MKRPIKPWTDERGIPLSDEALKIRSQAWDQATWEQYLKSLEVKASGRLLDPTHYQDLCNETDISIFSFVGSENNLELTKTIEEALLLLEKHSPKQAYVIREIFWNGTSQNQIARNLKLQQNAIFKLKNRGIQNLKTIMKDLHEVVTWAPYEGTHQNFLNQPHT